MTRKHKRKFWLGSTLRWLLFGKQRHLKLIREAVVAVAVGVAVFFMVSLIKDYSFYHEEDVAVQDRVQQFRVDRYPPAGTPPMVMIDFSQRDYHDWNYPPVAPREKLADLLDMAAAGRPKLIVVDIDLGWRGEAAGEGKLLASLTRLAEGGTIPVLLVRMPQSRGVLGTSDTLTATRFDDVVRKSQNIMWVSAQTRPDHDGVTRKLYAMPRVCPAAGTQFLPSVAIAACAGLKGPLTMRRLQSRIASLPSCNARPDAAVRDVDRSYTCGERVWPFGSRDATIPVTYRNRLHPPSGVSVQQVVPEGGSVAVPEIEVYDAADSLRTRSDSALRQQFNGRIVIIGSSSEHMGDWTMTPVGFMPGMMVVANAVRSAMEDTQRRAKGLAVGVGIVTLMSFITFAIWSRSRRVRGFEHVVFREILVPAMNVVWLIVIAMTLPDTHSQEFLYPQIVLSTYLLAMHGVEEWRHRKNAQPSSNNGEGHAAS